LVVEGTAVEQAVWVDAALGRYIGYDADLFAAAGVLAIGVASVCDDVQLSSASHAGAWIETVLIRLDMLSMGFIYLTP
jgi:hypothetical protein